MEAKNQAYLLGLRLKLPLHIVEGICDTQSEPRDRLLQVIIEFLKQVQPRPTWRAIVDALRSPAVNLQHLAMRVEAAHFPDPSAIREIPPETTTPAGMLPLIQENYIYFLLSHSHEV